jgi:hypothetical protein
LRSWVKEDREFLLWRERLGTLLKGCERAEENVDALRRGPLLIEAQKWYFLGDFEIARRYARRGVQIWRAGGVQYQVDDIAASAVGCLFYEALLE